MKLSDYDLKVLEQIYGLSADDIKFLERKFTDWHKAFYIPDKEYWGDLFKSLMDLHETDRGYLDLITVMGLWRPAKSKEEAELIRSRAKKVPKVTTILRQSKRW